MNISTEIRNELDFSVHSFLSKYEFSFCTIPNEVVQSLNKVNIFEFVSMKHVNRIRNIFFGI